MAKRRGNNEGSINKRQDGRYEAKLIIGYDEKGKAIRKSFYGKTRKEAQEKMDEAKIQLKLGTYVTDKKILFKAWLAKWLEVYAQPKVRLSTYEKYETLTRCHIIPIIGDCIMHDLRPEQIQRLYNQKLKSGKMRGNGGLSAKTVGEIHLIIHQALDQALKEGLLARNVADAVSKPQFRSYEITPLSLEQMQHFMQVIKDHHFYTAYLLECFTGLRRGELLGLRWKDIDLKNKTVTIKQSLIRTKQGLVMSEPKTAKSKRTIPIPDKMVSELKGHKAKQNKNKLSLGNSYHDTDLVFCNPAGLPHDPRNFTRHFEKVLADNDLPKIRFHDMRHSHATLLLMMNEHPKIVQERLGHSTIRMTLDTYSHVLPGLQEKATEKLNQALQIREKASAKEG